MHHVLFTKTKKLKTHASRFKPKIKKSRFSHLEKHEIILNTRFSRTIRIALHVFVTKIVFKIGSKKS